MKTINCGHELHLEGILNVIGEKHLSIGNGVSIGAGCYFNCWGGVTIGDYSVLSRNITIYSYDHNFRSEEFLPFGPEKICRPVNIGKYVWIGMNAAIAPGSHIGDGAVIGLNTVVSGDVPPNAIVVGAKARVVGYRDSTRTKRIASVGGFYTRKFVKN